MAKAGKKSQLVASGEELGEQLLQSVREMNAGLRGRESSPEVPGIIEAGNPQEGRAVPSWFGILGKTTPAVTQHDMDAIREGIAKGIAQDRDL